MESQKLTRDEHSWVTGMAEVGFNINHDAFQFAIHKTIAYRMINRFVQKSRLETARDRADRTKTITPLEERFIQIISRRVAFLQQTRFV